MNSEAVPTIRSKIMKKKQISDNIEIIREYGSFNMFFSHIKRFFFVLLIPVLAITCISFSTYTNSVKNERNDVLESDFSKSFNYMSNLIDELNKDYLYISSTSAVSMILSSENPFKESKLFQNSVFSDIRGTLSRFVATNSTLNSIHLYSFASDYVFSFHNSNYRKDFYNTAWYDAYQSSNENFYMTYSDDKFFVCYNISVSAAVEGILIFEFDPHTLLSELSFPDADTISVSSSDGTVLFSSDTGLTGTQLSDEVLSGSVYKRHSLVSSTYKIENANVYYTCTYAPNSNSIFYHTAITFLLIFLLAFGAVAYMFILSSRYMSTIVSALNTETVPEENTKSKLSFIVKNVMKIQAKNKEMEKDLVNSINQIRKAQSVALQSQLNTHFLFNTLNHIHLSIANYESPQNPACKMITLLSDLLYNSLSSVEYITSVENEIKYAAKYLELESIKYNNNFDIEWEIDDAVKDKKTLKMVLQPVIENSLTHGIRPMFAEKRGKISIKVFSVGDMLYYEVSDNGIGIEPEKLEELRASTENIDNNSSEHIGLKNINQRIKLIFGEEYGITIDSAVNEGTSVMISMPIIK